jgi:cation-transporting P-type ATPase E
VSGTGVERGARGLTSAEVADRVAAGRTNRQPDRTSRTYGEIVRANVLTRFNAIITALAVVVLTVGSPIDALFALVMVLNTVIGIVQEVRAKRTLDRLRVLVTPTVQVRRDGDVADVRVDDLVVDDVIELRVGDQVPVDGDVIESRGLEVDESALTGEADPVQKEASAEVRSGSAVVAGSATIVATRVGEEAWIYRLVAEAKEFGLATSELRSGVNRILQVIGWGIGPLALLLFWSQLRANESREEGLVAAVAGVVGLVPQGLVLLVSVALAVAILRLARNHVVVQELYAVEGLARVDVLCLDKTGTLTTGKMRLEAIEPLDGDDEGVRRGLAALAAAETSPTATLQVVADGIDERPDWRVDRHVAFSSARKWSGAAFAGEGTWVVGAPDIVLEGCEGSAVDAATNIVAAAVADAKRVLAVARSDQAIDGERLPAGLEPVGIVVLAEELRPDAADTLAYFGRQHVAVRVISGDDPRTVSAVATRLGLDGADRSVDMRTVDPAADEAAFDRVVDGTSVFGRVQPEQKRGLVDALKRGGHTVAMTGDGVNDIPALKRADIGIAVDTATPATRSVSQLVLLDGRFDRLPDVVGEGRRVIANMERVSSLFVTKTVYAAIFAVAIGVSGSAFPFLPRHLSLVSELTIGVPAFVLSFRAADDPVRPGYLRRVVRFAVPAGVVASVLTLVTYWTSRSTWIDASLAEARSASTLSLVIVAFWVLYRLVRPLDRLETVLLLSLIAVFVVIITVPWTNDLYAFEWPPAGDLAAVLAITAGGLLVLEAILRAAERRM